MKKYCIFILIVLTLFVGIERDNISLALATRLGDMSYYIGSDMSLRNYNEAVFLIQKKEYSQAKSLLQSLLNQEENQNPDAVYELYGDLVHEEGGASGDVLIFYNRSREFRDTSRIREKIAYIETGALDIGDDMLENNMGTVDAGTGADERARRRDELTSSGYSRNESIDLHSGMEKPTDIISRTLELITTDTGGVRDW